MSTEEKPTKPISHTPSSDFAKEVAEVEGGEAINKCIQCGICTASCVVAKATDVYRPRRMIQKIILGMKKEVLTSDESWYCMSCRMCEERCQEGVSPAEIFHAVREVYVRFAEILRFHLPGAILAAAQLGDALGGHVEGDDATDSPKGHGHRQPHVAEAQHRYVSLVWHQALP